MRAAKGPSRGVVARTYVILCATFLALALVSIPLLHWMQDAVEVPHPSIVEQAWVSNPGTVDHGVTAGASIHFVVVSSNSSPVRWVASSGGLVVGNGLANGNKGVRRVVTFHTTGAEAHDWLTLLFDGIKTPLQVWVR